MINKLFFVIILAIIVVKIKKLDNLKVIEFFLENNIGKEEKSEKYF